MANENSNNEIQRNNKQNELLEFRLCRKFFFCPSPSPDPGAQVWPPASNDEVQPAIDSVKRKKNQAEAEAEEEAEEGLVRAAAQLLWR